MVKNPTPSPTKIAGTIDRWNRVLISVNDHATIKCVQCTADEITALGQMTGPQQDRQLLDWWLYRPDCELPPTVTR